MKRCALFGTFIFEGSVGPEQHKILLVWPDGHFRIIHFVGRLSSSHGRLVLCGGQMIVCGRRVGSDCVCGRRADSTIGGGDMYYFGR